VTDLTFEAPSPIAGRVGQAQYDLAVVMGRFQPFHNGHLRVLRTALDCARRVLVVLGASAQARRPDRFPFTAEERREMVSACLGSVDRARVEWGFCEHADDVALELRSAEDLAAAVLAKIGRADNGRAVLIGGSPLAAGPALPPTWDWLQTPHDPAARSDEIRSRYFDADGRVDNWLAGPATRIVPAPVLRWLRRFRHGPIYRELADELSFVAAARRSWDAAPFPPIFVTVDAVVVQNGHVLLVQRGRRPGKGLWALPGGFVEQNERLLDATIRELVEETCLAVSESVLRTCLVTTAVFDTPQRSIRGRTITHASLFNLGRPTSVPAPLSAERQVELPAVMGGDDAAHARWWPLSDVTGPMMFEDHLAIIRRLTGQSAPGQLAL